MNYPAHIRILPDGTERIQSVTEHNRHTAEIAASCLESIGLADAAYYAGLGHDAGKNRPASRDYQIAVSHGEHVRRGSVIHTYQICRLIMENHNPEPSDFEDITRELTAFAASAHHGLYDCFGPEHTAGFTERIEKQQIEYDTAKNTFLHSAGGEDAYDLMFRQAHKCLSSVYSQIDKLAGDNNEEYHFYFSLLTRVLLSAVIEGDRRDTAEFMNDAIFPKNPKDMRSIWKTALDRMEQKLGKFKNDTPINRARSAISRQCRDFAENEGGVFRLNVPTGGGKTLSALRYALAHAKKYNKRRIIFTAPLLSILEQNSKILRDYIGDDKLILEHHSNVVLPGEDIDALADYELLAQSWDAPVVITTLVQLLNTMFDGKTSSIRRFWALCDSVVVIDEVQTVPGRYLSLFNLAVNFLSQICGVTFVLCSATQPCLEAAAHPLLQGMEDIVPYNEELWRPFRRTELVCAPDMPLSDIPAFARSVLDRVDSLLIVCNKKDEATYLFRELKEEGLLCFHLSASMCTAHRRLVLENIYRALENRKRKGNKVVCVSTQVIEAGVDISFSSVIRLTAGMDSIVQAAGRCNRNGESSEAAQVFIVNCTDEKLTSLKEIQMGKAAAVDTITVYQKQPERFGCDLTSDSAIAYYYKCLYGKMAEGYQDGAVPELRQTLFSLLSDNPSYANEDNNSYGKFFLLQAFRTAGNAFHVFDKDTQTAVVPFMEGEELIAEAAAWQYPPNDTVLSDWLERAKPYTVTLYEFQKKKLVQNGMYAIYGIPILQPFQYDDDTGVTLEVGNMDFMEV